jgi:hypothetical protein
MLIHCKRKSDAIFDGGVAGGGYFSGHTLFVKDNKPVWHGWAKKELTRSDIERSEAPIRTAVAAVLEKFPPR